MKKPLVSVIIPTKNEESHISRCLTSISNQTYPTIEVIVVDNNSTDQTVILAKRYTKKIYIQGPERSTQRNLGASKAEGKYLLFLDADMILNPEIIISCVEVAESDHPGGIIIPEISIGEGFWAKCKALEKEFYTGVDWIEAARFFNKQVFKEVGGYDAKLISGEDWNLSQRVKENRPIMRTPVPLLHDEGHLSLWKTVRKKYYYAKHINKYLSSAPKTERDAQTSLLKRYRLFFHKPHVILSSPFVWLGLLFMKTCEFAAGTIGYLNGNAIRL